MPRQYIPPVPVRTHYYVFTQYSRKWKLRDCLIVDAKNLKGAKKEIVSRGCGPASLWKFAEVYTSVTLI